MAQANASAEPLPPNKVAPGDDSGAPTSSRFRYQDEIAAAHCLLMARHGRVASVVCEWHADFAVEYVDGEWVLNSVKHHEGQAWSLAKLFEDGGLALLFDTWIKLDRSVKVVLCTNAALSDSASPISAKLIGQLCGDHPGDSFLQVEPTDQICAAGAWAVLKAATKQKLDNVVGVEEVPSTREWLRADGLPQGMVEAIRSFLGVLRIKRFPSRDHIRDHVIRQYVQPLLQDLGRDISVADACYDRLLNVVHQASRDNDGRPLDPFEWLAASGPPSAEDKLDERVRRRTIAPEQVLECLAVAHTSGAPLLPAGRRPPPAPGGRTLTRKLCEAKVGDDDQRQAQQLRDLWHDSWPKMATGFPQDLEVEYALEQDILNFVRSLKLQLVGADHFGTRLMAALNEGLGVHRLKGRLALPLHDHHVVGFAYELSDRCYFTFLDPGEAS
ncbi:dsDNA nuclease domain-containing protein [Saccharothrix variisporea]|uniref:Uncharacterized protein DUF4297 n=1 Tax=Saccharothrix variisporea TaxID=543527 RepID=A0A495XDB9_9PSEU|nr:dsDNA nuclease domain-containing protein [Saccharothrix variisporea]RKT69528.1 uncharacterized protein DUF4297 [Saccharothrix variisporea]